MPKRVICFENRRQTCMEQSEHSETFINILVKVIFYLNAISNRSFGSKYRFIVKRHLWLLLTGVH